MVHWLLPDEREILKRGLSAEELNQAREAFAAALAAAGYGSKDKIIELVREVKREQAAEWKS